MQKNRIKWPSAITRHFPEFSVDKTGQPVRGSTLLPLWSCRIHAWGGRVTAKTQISSGRASVFVEKNTVLMSYLTTLFKWLFKESTEMRNWYWMSDMLPSERRRSQRISRYSSSIYVQAMRSRKNWARIAGNLTTETRLCWVRHLHWIVNFYTPWEFDLPLYQLLRLKCYSMWKLYCKPFRSVDTSYISIQHETAVTKMRNNPEVCTDRETTSNICVSHFLPCGFYIKPFNVCRENCLHTPHSKLTRGDDKWMEQPNKNKDIITPTAV
jgi:hypothetical protein